MKPSTHGILDMARTIFGEARNQHYKGKLGVGYVIYNRWRNPGWWSENEDDDIKDHTLSAVVRDPYQFSCWNRGNPNRPKMQDLHFEDVQGHARFRECLQAALEVLNGDREDPTGNADHYFAEYIEPPKWADSEDFTTQIGVHMFYRIYL
jgi:spore germination cell wall hydrolase CwlJ-like protein